MSENFILGLSLILIIGIAAQWIAWRLKFPAILLLLISGIIAGPVTGLINPDFLFGNTLFPIVSLSVAVILFEGGLSLRISELKQIRSTVLSLITIGVIVTWILSGLGAYFILGLDTQLSVLFGAVLIVTGPTVIIPLLRQVRPTGQVGSVLKWEGIVNDPIGAMAAVLVFEVILTGGFGAGIGHVLLGAVKTIFFGGLTGVAGALIMYFLLRKHIVPDFLQNPVTLMFVITVFEASNLLQPESGLLSVTLMGIILANQRSARIKHIIEFKENLRVILISTLFIILAARLSIKDLDHVTLGSILFLVFLIIIVRPAAVYLSTIGSNLNWKEKFFLVGMAPRGIVAAAVSALFAYQLVDLGYKQAEFMVPFTFVVIIGTVIIYGLSAAPLARKLGVAKPVPRGILIMGAHEWAQKIAEELKKQDIKVLLADTNWPNISQARLKGLQTYYGNILAEYALDEINLDGIGHLLAMTPNDEVNSLATIRFSDIFGRSNVFQLSPIVDHLNKEMDISGHLQGRIIFGKEMNFMKLTELFDKGAELKSTNLTKEYTFETFKSERSALTTYPLFIITATGEVRLFTTDNPPEPSAGQKIISLSVPQ